jgi:hypothetical protein
MARKLYKEKVRAKKKLVAVGRDPTLKLYLKI